MLIEDRRAPLVSDKQPLYIAVPQSCILTARSLLHTWI